MVQNPYPKMPEKREIKEQCVGVGREENTTYNVFKKDEKERFLQIKEKDQRIHHNQPTRLSIFLYNL